MKGMILITGASGFLGSRLFSHLLRKNDVAGVSYSQVRKSKPQLDITDEKAVHDYFDKVRPKIVVHTAALSNADYCENNKEHAEKINISGTKNIVNACKKYRSKLIYVSSDYIFDGERDEALTEDEEPNPVNYYGLTKLKGEHFVQDNLKDYIIIRPTILFGFNQSSTKKTFVEHVIEQLQQKKPIEVDDVIQKYPLHIDTLCEAIQSLIDVDGKGTYHISPQQGLTRYEWALTIAEEFGLDNKLISPTKGKNPATKPKNVKLDSSKLLKATNINITEIKENLKIYTAQKNCMFRMIYSAKPNQTVTGKNVSTFRMAVGRELAKESPVDADVVMAVPESGLYGATGYSEESKTPLYLGIIRDYYTRKTIFETNKGLRSELLRQKLIFVPELIKDKRIVLVDEAVLSGITLELVVKKLKQEGAKEIHVRIPSPPMRNNCQFKILHANADLLAKKYQSEKNYTTYKEQFENEMKKKFGIDSFIFLSKEGFLKYAGKEYCIQCFE